MSTFTAVNSSRAREDAFFVRMQTSPAASAMMASSAPGDAAHLRSADDSSLRTPTRSSFGVYPSLQPPRPPSDASAAASPQHARATQPAAASPHHVQRPSGSSFERLADMGMDSDDGSEDDDDDGDAAGSENDAADGDDGSGPPAKKSKKKKKKKGQRFYCKDFPPCKLSFTRSEHLARHIRKHTGERPFQCHCARRFSRLDNLRQHAQTVHVNEDIPTDSLAATGTRFQRQVRTDRVRPADARARAATIGGPSGPARAHGHARNLSASSVISTASSVAYRDDVRRPPPLAMAADPALRGGGLSIDTYRSPPDSPAGYSTPTSATYSAGPGSPRFTAAALLRSPPNASIGPPSAFWSTSRTLNRRLSVPSGARPLQTPAGTPSAYAASHHFSTLSNATSSTVSAQSSTFASPTSTVFSFAYDAAAAAAPPAATTDTGLKRRTWHPETRSTYPSPLAAGPLAAYHPADIARFGPPLGSVGGVTTRLPGIESFDYPSPQRSTPPSLPHPPPPPPPPRPQSQQHPRPRPTATDAASAAPPPALQATAPPLRGPSPMQVDSAKQPPMYSRPLERSSMAAPDLSLHHNLNRLGINTSTPPTDARTSWLATPDGGGSFHFTPRSEPGHAAITAHQPRFTSGGATNATTSFSGGSGHAVPPGSGSGGDTLTRQAPETPRRNKRHGWYNGPLTAQRSIPVSRPSPEDSSGSEGVATPSASSVEVNPAIRPSNGWLDHEASLASLDPPKAAFGSSHPPELGSPTTPTSSQNNCSTSAAEVQPGAAYLFPSGVRPPLPPPPPPPPPPSSRHHASEPAMSENRPQRDSNMLRLEALVAVATSEDKGQD